MNDQEEHRLVVKALNDGLTNCVCWKNAKLEKRLMGELRGITPKGIRDELIRGIRDGSVSVRQKREDRECHSDNYEFVYFAVLPIDLFHPHGLLVEMVLHDDDPEVPIVVLVNAHPQTH